MEWWYTFELLFILNNGKIALLEVNISEGNIDKSNIDFFEFLEVGKLYSVSILYSTMSFYILSIENTQLRGYVEKESFDSEFDTDEELKLQLSRKASHPLQLSHFVIPIFIEDVSDEKIVFDDKVIRESSFFTSDEWSVTSPEDTELIKLMLLEYPTLAKDTITEIAEYPIFCRYGDRQPSKDLEKFINDRPDYFQNQTFWLNTFVDKEGKNKIVLFDENSTVIVVNASESEFTIDQFYAKKTTYTAERIIKRNHHTKLKISGDKLFFLKRTDPIPQDYSTERMLTYIERIKDLNLRILKEIKEKIGTKIESDSVEYGILQDFLEFEKNREENKSGGIVFIPSDKISFTAGSYLGDTTALAFKMSESETEKLIGNNNQTDEELYVSILDDEDKPIFSGKLSFVENDEYVLSFFDKHDLNVFRNKGIKIVRNSNTKHIDIQLSAIKGFVKKDSLNIHKDLVFDKFEIPDSSKYNDIIFFNKSIAKAEADNRQAEAVRKALGNKSMLLIQGPPGTGKTTVIVEIIRQLAAEGKKVLVCSQAHAAVDNIYNRIKSNDETLKILRINNEGKSESWGENFDESGYENFIKNNRYILQKLFSEQSMDEIRKYISEIKDYSEKTKFKYIDMHNKLCDYYSEIKGIQNKDKLKNILQSLQSDAIGITGSLLETQRYQSMDVIFGTCIGVGMNYILKKGSVRFDTVIIDEAAKANLAETIVPLRLGNRYILVGDDNQLPPYIDREKIKDFISQNVASEEQKINDIDVVKALSTSLFEDFHKHRNFPKENSVLLNYQYRMHPAIGSFISKLFYYSELRNGFGTEKEYIDIPRFPDPVIFFDTSNQRERAYETRELTGSYFNKREIDIICNNIIPEILPLLTENPNLRVGIISPYSAQCNRLRKQIVNKQLKESVYTIDSIQGSEFDIVVFSFVRSFSLKTNNNIGFLSDLRRLNVSLSRAKKKLVLVGNKNTLINPKAHIGTTNIGSITTFDVFKVITENTKSMFDLSSVDFFKQNSPDIGHVFKDCKWKYENTKKNFISFTINLKGYDLNLLMPFNPSKCDLKEKEVIDVLFKGFNNKNGKPSFECYDPSFDIFTECFSEQDIINDVRVKAIIGAGIIVNYMGVDGLIPSRYINEKNRDYFSKNKIVSLKIDLIKKKDKKVYYKPIIKTAEEFELGLLKKFTARVITIKSMDVQLCFVDNSLYTVQLPPMLCCLLDEGNEYSFYVTQQKVMLDRREEYNQFIETHDISNGIYRGLVKKEDERNFYVLVDGYCGTIIKNDFTSRRIQTGNSYYFSIYNVNDKNKSIQFKFEK